jgi:acetyl-CoA acetyltransferase
MAIDQAALKHRVAISGVGATRQGRHPDKDKRRLAVEALRAAIADAGISKDEIDGVLTLNMEDNSGLAPLDVARLIGINPRVTGGLEYSTGGFTAQYAAALVAAGICEVVLCVGARNPPGAMELLSGPSVRVPEYGLYNAGSYAALGWTRYRARYGATEETLGRVAVVHRDNARRNPNAAFTDPLTIEDYLALPPQVWPFRELDICKITAGAAAFVVTTAERANAAPKKPVYFDGVGRQQSARLFQNDEHVLCQTGMRSAAAQVFGAAGVTAADVDLLAMSDASTSAVVHTVENYGFCGEGEAPAFIAEGNIARGGSLPVNPDGGQLSGGYLVGWLHQVELVRQLRGEAGDRQVPGARVGMYTTTGRFREEFLATIYTVD